MHNLHIPFSHPKCERISPRTPEFLITVDGSGPWKGIQQHVTWSADGTRVEGLTEAKTQMPLDWLKEIANHYVIFSQAVGVTTVLGDNIVSLARNVGLVCTDNDTMNHVVVSALNQLATNAQAQNLPDKVLQFQRMAGQFKSTQQFPTGALPPENTKPVI